MVVSDFGFNGFWVYGFMGLMHFGVNGFPYTVKFIYHDFVIDYHFY